MYIILNINYLLYIKLILLNFYFLKFILIKQTKNKKIQNPKKQQKITKMIPKNKQ